MSGFLFSWVFHAHIANGCFVCPSFVWTVSSLSETTTLKIPRSEILCSSATTRSHHSITWSVRKHIYGPFITHRQDKMKQRSLVVTVLTLLLSETVAFSTVNVPLTKTSSLSSSSSERRPFGVASCSRPSLMILHAGDEIDEDEEDDPLGKGVDSVSWLPTVSGARGEVIFQPKVNTDVELPLFPLGGIVYTPNSEHSLNIFEPRYRQLYTDILMNGSKRFVVVMSHPTQAGRFAQTGVLFELEDLKEVSEQTNDQIKYVCKHRVTGRVKISKVLNAEAWESRDTYLRVTGTIINDTDPPTPSAIANDVYGAIADVKEATQAEEDLKVAFMALIDVQHEMEENVRFTRASADDLMVGPDPNAGLWQFIRLWQSYADQRLMQRQKELQEDFQIKLQDYLKKEKGMKQSELPSVIGFQDLSPALQQEVKELQQRMAVELEPLVLESTLTMQKILEAEEHKDRCNLVRHFVDAERKRLDAKKLLRGMFTGSDSSLTTTTESALGDSSSSSDDDDASGPTGALLIDEPDAFQ